MKEFKCTIGKHIFTLVIPASIENAFAKFKPEDYDPEKSRECGNCTCEDDCVCDDYAYYYDMRHHNSSDDDYLPCKEAMKLDGQFIQDCLDYYNNLDVNAAVASIAKKKNGTFRKGAVEHIILSPLGSLSEEEYGYRRDCFRWKAIDDLTAELQFTSYVDKW